MNAIDLNCDLGEGAPDDAAIIPFVTSVSIACGGHAGDAVTMRDTLRLCEQHGVAVGAHPGFEDREGFGRRPRALAPDDVVALVVAQVGALAALARQEGLRLQHVKPHGALYNLAASDATLARAIARAVRAFDPHLVLVGQPHTEHEHAARAEHVRFAAEAFVDRALADDGRLVPRGAPGAKLEGDDEALAVRAVTLVRDGYVETVSGARRTLAARTLCLHGDDPRTRSLAPVLGHHLKAAGIQLRPLGALVP